ncbi:hypothetical protein R6Q59_014538 [Mikania micrantha]
MEAMESLDNGSNFSSLNGDDSNIIIMMQKKNKKSKEKNSKQGSLKSKKKERPRLSSSHKRKLKKLEEDKEKTLLLSKSLETLEKYKIQDDAYSLMWSSRNLGQVETAREKRRREVQFAKTGLVLQHSDRPLKRRDNKSDSAETYSNEEDVSSQPVKRDIEVTNVKLSPLESFPEGSCNNGANIVDALDPPSFVMKLDNEHTDTSILEDPKSSLVTPDCCKSIAKSMEVVGPANKLILH